MEAFRCARKCWAVDVCVQGGVRAYERYDAYGRQCSVTDARDGKTSSVLDVFARRLTVTSPPAAVGQAPQVTIHQYDVAEREVETTLPDNSQVSRQYHPLGMVSHVSGSQTYPVEYSFDAQGRLKTLTTSQNYGGNQGSAVTTWNYNWRGLLQNKVYAGNVPGPSYTYTPGGRLKTRTWARGVQATYHYAFETPANGNLSGDLVQVSYSNDPANTPAVEFTFDRLGRPNTSAVNGGPAATFSYNNADELLAETYTAGPLAGISVTNGYDGLFRRTSLSVRGSSGPLASAGYGYDGASRLQTVSQPSILGSQPLTATYTYLDNSSLNDHITFQQGMSIAKSYDHLDRLLEISSTPSADAPVTFGYTYDRLNQRTNVTTPGGSWEFGYDSLGQVTSGRKHWTDRSPVAGEQFEYVFDQIGNRRIAKSGGDATGQNLRQSDYTPDLLNRLLSRTVPNSVDVLGEVTNASAGVLVNGQVPSRKNAFYRAELTFDNQQGPVWGSVTNQALIPRGTSSDLLATVKGSVFIPQNQESFGYDADGNLTSDGRWSYSWDAENRLIGMESLGNAPVGSKRKLTFEYDWQSRRTRLGVSTWTNNAWSVTVSNSFAYDGWNLVAELNATNRTLIRSYLWGSDLSGTMQGAGGVGGLLAVSQISNSQILNPHLVCFDGNGNVAALVSAADGKLSAQYEYGPFGELLRATGPMAFSNLVRFSTKYQDTESGLLYYGFRYYDPINGKWNSPDPLEEYAGFNVFSFVFNRPLAVIDLFGMGAWVINEAEIDLNRPEIVAEAYLLTESSGYEVVYKPDPKECPDGKVVVYQTISRPGWFTGVPVTVDRGSDMFGHHPKDTASPLPPPMKPIKPSTPNSYQDSPSLGRNDPLVQLTAVAVCRVKCKQGRLQDRLLSTYYFEFDSKTRKITKRDPKYKKHFKKAMETWWEEDKPATIQLYYQGSPPW